MLSFKLPNPTAAGGKGGGMETKILSNGLTVVLAPRSTNTAAIAAAIRGGARAETPKTSGISHLLEHVISRSSRRYPSMQDLSRELDRLGGESNAETTTDLLWTYMKLAARELPRGIEIIADLLLHPKISKESVEAEKRVILQEIAEKAPEDTAAELLNEIMFRGHPLSLSPYGLPPNIESFTATDVRRHWRRMTKPNNMVIAVAGRFDRARIFSQIEKLFSRMRPGLIPPRKPFTAKQTSRRFMFRTADIPQVRLVLGFPVCGYGHRDAPALSALADILGQRESSRLYLRLRSNGSVYGAHTEGCHWEDTGRFMIETGTQPEYAEDAVKIIMEELRDLRERLIPKDEFLLARSHMKSIRRGAWDEPLHIAQSAAGHFAVNGRTQTYRAELAAIDEITRRRLRNAARRAFSARRLNFAVLGPLDDAAAKRIKNLLRL